jgi:hypothetical protein
MLDPDAEVMRSVTVIAEFSYVPLRAYTSHFWALYLEGTTKEQIIIRIRKNNNGSRSGRPTKYRIQRIRIERTVF